MALQKNTDESYEKIYSNEGNRDVLNLLPSGAKYILDIGCGDGSNARLLIQKDCIVDGITISEEEKNAAQKVMRQVYLYNVENGLPIEGSGLYDAVICSHVLEHICYPSKLMADIYRVMKKDAVLIVALPNIMHYRSRWKLLRGDFNYEAAGIWDFTHFRWYTFKTGKELLQQHLTVDVATVTGEMPFNSIFKKLLPGPVRKSVYSMLIKISKGFFGYQLLYRAVKK